MNKTEVAKLLTVASMVDNRTVARETVEAWFPLLQDIEYQDGVEGVQMHFRETDKYLMPAHVRANAKRARRDRELREERQNRRAIEPRVVTLDRQEFERQTREAIEQYTRGIGVIPE